MSTSADRSTPFPPPGSPDPLAPAGTQSLSGDAAIAAVERSGDDVDGEDQADAIAVSETSTTAAPPPATTTGAAAHRHSVDPKAAIAKLGRGIFSPRVRRWRRLLQQINDFEPTL